MWTIFIYADDILHFIGRINLVQIVVLTVIINLLVIYLTGTGFIVIGHLPYYYATALSGISLFALLFKLCQFTKPVKVLYWISMVSYEIYLIHHPLCLGEFSLFNLFPFCSTWFIVASVFSVTFIFSYLLHIISRRLNKIGLHILSRCLLS